ncbi:hypothetical protein Avbf_05995 [Armadillidium vulgare]|nr:hypothetical protein Avbf_05995 [Armadillidium vulgare]
MKENDDNDFDLEIITEESLMNECFPTTDGSFPSVSQLFIDTISEEQPARQDDNSSDNDFEFVPRMPIARANPDQDNICSILLSELHSVLRTDDSSDQSSNAFLHRLKLKSMKLYS